MSSDMKEPRDENNSDNETEKKSINWIAVLYYLYLHLSGIIGLYLLFTKAKWMTVFYFSLLTTITFIGITSGAHRLYAHSTFVATSQLRLFVVLAHTLAGVGSIYNWVFWHRIHHKFYCTERDPYNHNKGFFYSHVISNVLSTPSDLEKYAKDIDMRDVDADVFVWIQRKFYWLLFIISGVLLPINAPIEYWNESFLNSLLIIGAARLLVATHISWLVNSALLVWGLNKADKFPVDNNSVFFIDKSYWLNYHYIVSWDYKNDEFGKYNRGFATFIIKMWRELDLINEMKTNTTKDVQDALYKIASEEMTMKEALAEMKQKAEEAAYKEKLTYHH